MRWYINWIILPGLMSFHFSLLSIFFYPGEGLSIKTTDQCVSVIVLATVFWETLHSVFQVGSDFCLPFILTPLKTRYTSWWKSLSQFYVQWHNAYITCEWRMNSSRNVKKHTRFVMGSRIHKLQSYCTFIRFINTSSFPKKSSRT